MEWLKECFVSTLLKNKFELAKNSFNYNNPPISKRSAKPIASESTSPTAGT